MFHWPVIVKPTDSAGSKGVTRVDRPEDLPAAVSHALDFSHCDEFIVEDFITQKGFSSDTDCFSVDGELRFVSFNNQRFDPDCENPYAPAGFSWPSSMSGEHQEELKNELQRLLRLLGMRTALYNIECREGTDGKAYLMEVSPRGGGNRLCEMVQHTTGVNLIRNAVKAALGLPVEEMEGPHYSGWWSYVALHSYRSGRFDGLQLHEEVLPSLVEEDLWVQEGDAIEAFSGANKTIGTLVFNWPSRESRDAHMADINAWLSILVEE
jgi:biotin carboxylase